MDLLSEDLEVLVVSDAWGTEGTHRVRGVGLDRLSVLVTLDGDEGTLRVLLARENVPAQRAGILAVDRCRLRERVTELVLLSL